MNSRNDKTQTFAIHSESDVARATYVTRQFAEDMGFNTVNQSMIATAVSELASNIVKYAGRGYITIAKLRYRDQLGIEVVAEDRGPGISDRVKALTDNISTGNTLGLGLPGVRRMMDEFLIDSAEGMGTKIVVRKWKPISC